MTIMLDVKLPADPRAAASARRSLHALAAYLDSTFLEELELLVSELVTNSLRHGELDQGSWVALRVDADGVLHVEVSDPGRGFALESAGAPSRDLSGWGLYLVDRIADRWGRRARA
jgi:anti-sigma regulatory factor (Ser/Thr protein kinase)